MSKSKTVLGRGLNALLSAVPEITPEQREGLPGDDGRSVGTICTIDLSKVRANPFQPRIDFNVEALEELKISILENGIIQPITVRRVEGGFELISGERRVRASRDAGLTEIPAYILNVESDRAMLELALIENVQRENLNAIEVALGYQRLIEECTLTQEEVSQKVGKDRSTVTNFLRLLKLPSQIQNSLRENEITMGHARALLTIPEDSVRLDLWRKVRDEALSVRRTEALAKEIAHANNGKGRETRPQQETPKAVPEGRSQQQEILYTDISSRLQQTLGTQVRIKPGAGGGWRYSGGVLLE